MTGVRIQWMAIFLNLKCYLMSSEILLSSEEEQTTYNNMQRHGWILTTCRAKEDRRRRVHTVSLHLQETLEKAGLIFAEESWHSGCLRGGRQGTAGKEREGLLWDAALVLYVLRGVGHTAVYICTYSLSCTLRVCEFHWGKLEIIQVSHHFKNAISIVSGIPLVRVQLGINVWRTFMLSIKNLEILVLLT